MFLPFPVFSYMVTHSILTFSYFFARVPKWCHLFPWFPALSYFVPCDRKRSHVFAFFPTCAHVLTPFPTFPYFFPTCSHLLTFSLMCSCMFLLFVPFSQSFYTSSQVLQSIPTFLHFPNMFSCVRTCSHFFPYLLVLPPIHTFPHFVQRVPTCYHMFPSFPIFCVVFPFVPTF